MANLGRVGIVPKGAYSAAAEYRKLDLVTDGGSAFLYVSDTPSTGTALSDPKWSRISEGAFAAAVAGGYTGASADFYTDLGAMSGLAADLAGV